MDLRNRQSARLSHLPPLGQNLIRAHSLSPKFPFGVPHADAAGRLDDPPFESCETRFLLVRAVFRRAVPHRPQRKYLGSIESHLRPIFLCQSWIEATVISRAAWRLRSWTTVKLTAASRRRNGDPSPPDECQAMRLGQRQHPFKTVLSIAHRGHWLADSPPYAYQPNQG